MLARCTRPSALLRRPSSSTKQPNSITLDTRPRYTPNCSGLSASGGGGGGGGRLRSRPPSLPRGGRRSRGLGERLYRRGRLLLWCRGLRLRLRLRGARPRRPSACRSFPPAPGSASWRPRSAGSGCAGPASLPPRPSASSSASSCRARSLPRCAREPSMASPRLEPWGADRPRAAPAVRHGQAGERHVGTRARARAAARRCGSAVARLRGRRCVSAC